MLDRHTLRMLVTIPAINKVDLRAQRRSICRGNQLPADQRSLLAELELRVKQVEERKGGAMRLFLFRC